MNTLRNEAIIIANISDRPNFPSIKRKIWDCDIHKGIEQGTANPIIEVRFTVEHWVDDQWTENDSEIILTCRKGEILTDGSGNPVEPYADILQGLKYKVVHLADVFVQWITLRDADGTIDAKLIANNVYKS